MSLDERLRKQVDRCSRKPLCAIVSEHDNSGTRRHATHSKASCLFKGSCHLVMKVSTKNYICHLRNHSRVKDDVEDNVDFGNDT